MELWEQEYNEYWDNIDASRGVNRQGYLPYSQPEKSGNNVHTITDKPSCDFCGMSVYDGKVVRNTEFDDMYDFCDSCAKTLVPMGGLEYVV
jgi:hypothetical protein